MRRPWPTGGCCARGEGEGEGEEEGIFARVQIISF